MKVVLASINQAKIEATNKIFSKVFKDIAIIPIESDSGVSKTPMSDDEGIQGCMNRITNTKEKVSDADIYVGLEGILTTNSFGIFLCGWAAVELMEEGRIGIGCSAKVRIPNFIAQKADSFRELSTLVKENYPSSLVEEMTLLGSNGIITQKMYTRTDEFEHAIQCALGYALNKSNF